MNLKSLLKTLLKYYGVFAVLNVFYKIFIPFLRRRRAKKLWKHLPGEDCDPMATQMRKYAASYDVLDFFLLAPMKYQNTDLIKQPSPEPSLVFNSPRSIKWLLKDEFKNVTKPGSDQFIFALMRQFLGEDGIFTLQHGEKNARAHDMWLKQRKISAKIFTKANFMTVFYQTFIEKADIFVKVLDENAEKQIDLQDLFFSFTMDSIEKFFMGVEVNTVEGGMSNYAKAFDSAHKAMMQIMAEHAGDFILQRALLPYPFGTLTPSGTAAKPWFARIKLLFSKSAQQFYSSIENLDKHVYKYVKGTRKAADLSERKDIIANFLNSKIGNELNDKTLRDIVVNLTIAGRDTTACALSWAMFELTQNKEVQEKLIEEVDEKLNGRKPTLADFTHENMPYLNGVVYEALRLHPPVPNESKQVIDETVYLDGTVIPAGTMCYFSPVAIGLNPLRFPDPTKFDPARWIPFKEPTMYEFPVFQAGNRFCLGKDMAQFEMKLLLCMIFQRFTFTMKESEAEKVRYSLMLTNSIAINKKRSISALNVIPHKRE